MGGREGYSHESWSLCMGRVSLCLQHRRAYLKVVQIPSGAVGVWVCVCILGEGVETLRVAFHSKIRVLVDVRRPIGATEEAAHDPRLKHRKVRRRDHGAIEPEDGPMRLQPLQSVSVLALLEHLGGQCPDLCS